MLCCCVRLPSAFIAYFDVRIANVCVFVCVFLHYLYWVLQKYASVCIPLMI